MNKLSLTFLACIVMIVTCVLVWGEEITRDAVIRPAERTMLDSVVVTGIDSSGVAALLPQLLSQQGGVLNSGLVAHDIETIAAYLRAHGRWNSSVASDADTTHAGLTVLTFTVTASDPVILGEVTIDGEDIDAAGISLPDLPSAGVVITSEQIESMLTGIIAAYTAYGFQDISLHPTLTARNDTVDVHIMIDEGTRAIVDSIVIAGLTRTRPDVVRRELAHLTGLDAGPEITIAATAAVERLSIVRTVQPPYISYTDDGTCVLVLELQEGSQGSFEGVLGYQPGVEGESGEMVGKIDLAFPNLMGTGRAAHIRWENLGQDTEDLELRYREPWIFGRPFAVYGSFMQEQRERSGYTKTMMLAGVHRDLGRLRAGLGFRYEKVSADSSDSASAYGLDAEVIWDGLDNPSLPRSGIRYAARWSGLTKRYRFVSGNDHRFDRLELDLDHYVPTLTNQTAAILLRYRQVNIPDDRLTLADRFWLGGSSSIRGYRERIFPAVEAFWASIEYRLLQGRGSWFFLFADSGYIENVTAPSEGVYKTSSLIRTGYGFGFRLSSPAGRLGFDYGLGKGDGLSEGKLHVRLTSSF